MGGQDEPPENIGGAYGAAMGDASASEPASRAEAVVDRLGERYWRKQYGGQDAFRCLVRTILSQNTSDVVSQPAFDRLLERFDDGALAEDLVRARRDEIADSIREAGLYNQKAAVIQTCAERIIDEFGDAEAFDRFVAESAYEEARATLLDFDGVGPKTADCVLLFAGGRPGIFPVDTHVHRLARRLGIAPADADHEDVRAILEGRSAELDRADADRWSTAGVPGEKCGFGHTAMIQFGRDFCTARRPACLDGPEACPLSDLCEQVGVDPDSGTVVDPAATVEHE